MSIEIDHGGKVALVTGAGAGIGREIACWMARAGATVAVNDVRPEMADETIGLITDEGGRAVPIIANCREDGQIEAMVEQTVAELGDLDFAINNIGNLAGRTPLPVTDADASWWREIVEQNLLLTALCAQAEAKAMIEQGHGGVIVNVSSGESTRPSTYMAAYGAAKAGINHLTTTMAVELGPRGIRVCAMAPGTTLTETVVDAFPPGHYEAVVASTPLQRETLPEELARLAVWLTSDLARCVTGQLILADAGAHLSRSRPQNIGAKNLGGSE